MNRRYCRFFVVWMFAVLCLGGCALPGTERVPDAFLSQFERDVHHLIAEGLAAAKRGRYTEAEFAFRKALVALPQNESLQRNLATALSRQQIFVEAEEIYRDLLERTPQDLRAQSGLARLYTDQQRYDEAIAWYQRIIDRVESSPGREEPELKPIAVAAARNIAAIYYRLGFEERATCFSEQALRFAPAQQAEIARHARLLLSRGELESLVDLLKSVDPQNAASYLSHQVVLSLYETEKTEEAEELCEALLKAPAPDTALESDCLWILALTKGFRIVHAESATLDEEIQVQGFELTVRDPESSSGTLFLPFKLTKMIEKRQRALLEEEAEVASVDELTLFAYPRRPLPDAEE
ncbi:tetratricopeptide repeat protein [bacterium]|nr:tetratricopeptide repeat protein [bacterium]